jgi:hypothetical protein
MVNEILMISMYFSLLNSVFGSAIKQQKHIMQVLFSKN